MPEIRIVLATFNRHKFEEISSGFQVPGVELVSLSEYPEVRDAPEDGSSFEEIARAKAEFYFQAIREPVLSEDSGLVIPSLDGFPGIYSARIAADDRTRIELILNRLEEQELQRRQHSEEEAARRAFYVCSMALRTSKGLWTSEGRCWGTICRKPEGTSGFGYDPIFIPDGSSRTFGNMTREEKALFSHRIRALRIIIPVIQTESGGDR